jgi:signal peptidase II
LDSRPTDQTPGRSSAVVRWAVLLGPAAVVFAIDQLSKAWVMANLAVGETITPIPALADFLAITRSANRGAAFSFLPQAGDLFLIIALVMIAGILLFYRRMQFSRWIERFALGLLLGGVMGNALDRIRFGTVVDFVHLQIKPIISNVSNPADHAIVLGVGILFVVQWLASRRQAQGKSSAAPAGQTDEPPPAPQP